LSIADINGIEGCTSLKKLELYNCKSLTGLFSGHHPMMSLIQNPSFAVVPNTRELRALTYLDLSSTGITGTVGFDPMMTADFCFAFQTSTELKGASI
jgi:Leucine-rich repeat (LRR) protein